MYAWFLTHVQSIKPHSAAKAIKPILNFETKTKQ